MVALPERPFFIVGSPRSGTTLLRFILSSNPRLHVPGEMGFLPFVPKDAAGELSPHQVERVLQRIGQLNRNWDEMVEDVTSFTESLRQPTLRHVLDALYRRKIAPYGARRWGDKTPSYVRYIPTLDQIFPTAQFVHVIRDGRDVTLSPLAKWGQERWYMDSYYLLKNWARNVTQGREAGRRLGPDRYLETHYEDLVQRPRDTIRSICSFLDERFTSQMLNHTILARHEIGAGGHTEVTRPISTASVSRWRSEMTAFDRQMADQIAGPTLSRLGYRTTDTEPLHPSEWRKLFLLAAKYRLVDAVRGMLMALGLLTLNRGKRQ